MSTEAEQSHSWLDDPEKTTAAVTGSALAVFAIVHEMVPAHHQDIVRYLGAADFALNVFTWISIHRSRQVQETQDIPSSVDYETQESVNLQ